MRIALVILVIVELLLRGVAVPHAHAHDEIAEPAHHSHRPHVHLAGHSHSHAGDHPRGNHAHTHRHGHRHHESDAPRTRWQTSPSPHSSGHDGDAVYVSGETLSVPMQRVSVPEPVGAGWRLSDLGAESTAVHLHLTDGRAAGPPGKGLRTERDRLPHLLRI